MCLEWISNVCVCDCVYVPFRASSAVLLCFFSVSLSVYVCVCVCVCVCLVVANYPPKLIIAITITI